MAKITAIVTAVNNDDKLRYTLESIVSQSTEEFNVLIVTPETEGDLSVLAKKYADEYVGFETFSIPDAGIPAARNAGVKKAETELVFFVDEGDYIAPEFVEKISEADEKENADIYSPRLYVSGENEPFYLDWTDMLATVPHIDKFDRALLNTLDVPGRVYKKKFFDLYGITFPQQPVLFNAEVFTKCVLGCGAAVSGVAGAVYDKKSGVYADGFSKGDMPNDDNFAITCRYFDGLLNDIREITTEETGSFDGDEYTYQEANYVYFSYLTDFFYRYFWYLSDELLEKVREKFEELTGRMTPERKKKLAVDFADLRFPGVYTTRKDAASLPMVSLLGDFTEYTNLPLFIDSLFRQRLPFFELFLRESAFNKVPEIWKNSENLHFIPDNGFFAKARSEAKGVPINVKDTSPLDPKVLSELSLKKLPKSLYQYAFATARKKYAAKTFLKKKGMAIR